MASNLPLKLTHAESVAVRAAMGGDFARWLPAFLDRFSQHDRDNLILEVADELRRLSHRIEDEAIEHQRAPRGTNGAAHHLLAEGTAPKGRP